MTPEEIMLFYKTGKYKKDIEKRIEGMIYLYRNSSEYILVDEDLDYYESLINKDLNNEKTIFNGKVACKGYAKGKVTKLLRRADVEEIGRNNIILTHEGDPDLLPVIKKAGAIVCEQGGVTCHMAIIAREYGIPCVIGVGNNVINQFKEGEFVEVNATEGYIKRSEL